MYNNILGRFKFIIKNNINFNYTIYINIIYIGGWLVFYVINKVILFQAAKFLKDIFIR